jgi:hypothetical protein
VAFETIPEIDVLIATGIWLHSQGWTIESISVARGQGIDTYEDKQKLRAKFSEAKVPHEDIIFNSSGADLTARKDSTTWKIECKGLGTGTPQTLRNNFDRTLASAVSYFDQKNDLCIGLAMPKDYTYINLIRSKIPQALREAINLWILLYNPDGNTIVSYEPNKTV